MYGMICPKQKLFETIYSAMVENSITYNSFKYF